MQWLISHLKKVSLAQLILYIVIAALIIIVLSIGVYELYVWRSRQAKKQRDGSSTPNTDSTRHANTGSTESGRKKRKRAVEKQLGKSQTQEKLSMVMGKINQSFSRERLEKESDSFQVRAQQQEDQIEMTSLGKKRSKGKNSRDKKGQSLKLKKKSTQHWNQGENSQEDFGEKEDKQPVCYLCKRTRPVFTGDDQLRRLPESTLSPFLKQLKYDSKFKHKYLQQLRITPKFIQACKCKKQKVHIYCKTANVIQTKRIYCDKCECHFELHLIKKQVALVGNFIKIVSIILVVLGVVYSFFLFDAQLRCRINDDFQSKLEMLSENSLGKKFRLFNQMCVRFASMLRILFILSIMIIWALYYSVTQQKHKAAVLSYVEVLPYDTKQVSRKMSKQNLHTIREANAGRKIENMLFDRFWYQSRVEKAQRRRVQKFLGNVSSVLVRSDTVSGSIMTLILRSNFC